MASQKDKDSWYDNVFGSMFKKEKDENSQVKVETTPPSSGTKESGGDFFSWVGDKASACVDSLNPVKQSSGTIGGGGGGGGDDGSADNNTSTIEAAPDAIDSINIDSLSVKELKDLIKRAGLSDSSCFEKADLKEQAKIAKQRLQDAALLRRKQEILDKRSDASKAASDVASQHGKYPIRIIAGLECVCVGENNLMNATTGKLEYAPDYIIFCFHGYQATAISLAPLADIIRSSLEHSFTNKISSSSQNQSPRVLIILPQSKGSGWWSINFASYAMAMAMGESAKARVLRQIPSGVPECRVLMKSLLSESRTLYSSASAKLVPWSKIFFMGFSQGAMLALDTALHVEEPIGGVVLVSGFLMDVDKWGERLSQIHRNIKVLQLHGVNDPLIPFGTAQWLKGLLENFSTKAVFVPHGGGHDIPPHVLTTVCGFLSGAMMVE